VQTWFIAGKSAGNTCKFYDAVLTLILLRRRSFVITVYKHTYGMEISSIDQRFSTGVRQHSGVTRKVLRCVAGVWGNIKEKRENFDEYKNR
jgi:hypothetical protein